jgi:proteasome lid subunit RPN8/RPN11
MTLEIPSDVLRQIHAHGEASYPLEGAGLLLGRASPAGRKVLELLPLANDFEPDQRHRRYRLDPLDLLQAEDEADERGLDIVGIFHSHPDHPPEPSDYDLEWSLPFYSYVITSVYTGKAEGSRSWRLEQDRRVFQEEEIILTEGSKENQ